jgi:hypothetical protein
MIFGRIVAYLIRAAMLMVSMAVPAYLVIASFAIFEPYLLPLRYLKARVETVNEHLVIGPYADLADLASLKASGVTTVVSLLDPSVIYERGLIEREVSDVAQVGLRFVNLPVRGSEAPTSSMNRQSVQGLDALISARPADKIYVHGFLDAPRELVAQELRKTDPGGRLK